MAGWMDGWVGTTLQYVLSRHSLRVGRRRHGGVNRESGRLGVWVHRHGVGLSSATSFLPSFLASFLPYCLLHGHTNASDGGAEAKRMPPPPPPRRREELTIHDLISCSGSIAIAIAIVIAILTRRQTDRQTDRQTGKQASFPLPSFLFLFLWLGLHPGSLHLPLPLPLPLPLHLHPSSS